MKSFYETMAVMYVDYYNKYGEEKTYEFVLTTKVSLSVLNVLYANFIVDGVPALETIEPDKKETEEVSEPEEPA